MDRETPIHHENRSLQRTGICIKSHQGRRKQTSYICCGWGSSVCQLAKAWTEAPLGAEAPRTDLQLGLILDNLKKLIQRIRLQGKAARSVLERQLWYLSDETVGIAMFSDRVTIEEKETLVAGLSREATDGMFEAIQPF